MKHTINKEKKVVYVALNFATGLTDLTLYVRKPDGTTLDPIVMTEQGEGIYTASYTPDAVGIWQEKVVSQSNHDKIIRSYLVVNYDEDDLYSKSNTIENKIDTVQSDITYIKNKVDSIDEQVNPGGYFA